MSRQKIRYKAVKQAVTVGGTSSVLINPDNSQTVISGTQLDDAFCNACSGVITDDVRTVDNAIGCIGSGAREIALLKCLTESISLARARGDISIVENAVVFTTQGKD